MRNKLRDSLAFATVLTVGLGSSALADVNQVPYPKVEVEITEAYKPDAAFGAMRKALADAASRKDANALFALVAPGFVWAVNGAVANGNGILQASRKRTRIFTPSILRAAFTITNTFGNRERSLSTSTI